MIKIKRFAALIIAVLTLAVVFACSSGGKNTGDPTLPADTGNSGHDDRLSADDGLGDIKFTGKNGVFPSLTSVNTRCFPMTPWTSATPPYTAEI